MQKPIMLHMTDTDFEAGYQAGQEEVERILTDRQLIEHIMRLGREDMMRCEMHDLYWQIGWMFGLIGPRKRSLQEEQEDVLRMVREQFGDGEVGRRIVSDLQVIWENRIRRQTQEQ